MRSASLRALPFLRGRLLWTRWGLLHRTQLGGLPHSGLGDEASDVLSGRHVEGRVPGRTPLRGDWLSVVVVDILRGAILDWDFLSGKYSVIECGLQRSTEVQTAVLHGDHSAGYWV